LSEIGCKNPDNFFFGFVNIGLLATKKAWLPVPIDLPVLPGVRDHQVSGVLVSMTALAEYTQQCCS
jgi:hypothetical protein